MERYPRGRGVAMGIALALTATGPVTFEAWNNGPSGNTTTNTATECSNPPYSTHDWIAEHALDLLPDDEKGWLVPNKALYLLGTEAPDNRTISTACAIPNRGYDDRSRGHSIEWNAGATEMLNDRAAVRAQEEYSKAVVAFQQGELGHAAYYLGAMAHYIGDVSQYGHSWGDETHHGDYESWAATRTDSFSEGVFESFIDLDSLVRRTPYTATRRISQATFAGKGAILPAMTMDSLYPTKPLSYVDIVGTSLNLGVNELADVLHTFFLNVVEEDDD
jgi:hypothetical protein